MVTGFVKGTPSIRSENLRRGCARIWDSIDCLTPIRINRYQVGDNIEMHIDHIHSIFDGVHKGIPIISFVGVLNDDYEGGEFMIRGEKLPLKAGDVAMFPSCYLYPHEVKSVTKGTRYSIVAWGF